MKVAFRRPSTAEPSPLGDGEAVKLPIYPFIMLVKDFGLDTSWLALICAGLRWFPLISAGSRRGQCILRHAQAPPACAGLQREQQFWRDHLLANACTPNIVRVHTFGGIVFLLWSNEISTFFDLLMDQGAHLGTVHAFDLVFGASCFCIGLTKYQHFWFLHRFVCCIGRPFDHHSWALRNRSQIENVEIAQGFSYVFDTTSNHIEWLLPTNKNSWAIRNHQQIENYRNYTRFFILFSNHIEWILRTLKNSWAFWNHRHIGKCQYFIRPME